MENIAERLSLMEDLYFPRSLHSDAVNPSRRKILLLDLLSRDSAVFLERYGSKLTSEEVGEFDALRENNYEIEWHVSRLRRAMNPTSDEVRSRSVAVKNRRRAYLEKLVCGGKYFSEESMREREPYLHHEYLGQFQDLTGRGMARPGERWSETLLRRAEEAVLVAKIRAQQQRLGVAQRDWVGNEAFQEEEEEEDDDEEDATKKSVEISSDDQDVTSGAQSTVDRTLLSDREMREQMDQFTHIMQQKFLLGEDSEYLDYSKIDNDETLDDHWQREANHDAEEKYFAED